MIIDIPSHFWNDHVSRNEYGDMPIGVVVKELSRTTRVDFGDEPNAALLNLRTDAEYCASEFIHDPVGTYLRGVAMSAAAALRAIDRAE